MAEGDMYDPDGPATPRQRRYAQALGIKFGEETTGREISRLIDAHEVRLRSTRPATEKQMEFATHLGILFDPSTVTEQELRQLLTAEVARQSTGVLRSNTALRPDKVILYDGMPHQVRSISVRRWTITMVPYAGGPTKTVRILSVADATEVSESVLRAIRQRMGRRKSS